MTYEEIRAAFEKHADDEHCGFARIPPEDRPSRHPRRIDEEGDCHKCGRTTRLYRVRDAYICRRCLNADLKMVCKLIGVRPNRTRGPQ